MGTVAEKKCRDLLRRVVVWDEANQRQIVLLSNHLEFGATTIAAIYQDRWEIELFLQDAEATSQGEDLRGHQLSWSFSNLATMLRLTCSPTVICWSFPEILWRRHPALGP